MTRDGDFKRVVRARMAKTGESYATARSHLRATPDPSAAPATSETGATNATAGPPETSAATATTAAGETRDERGPGSATASTVPAGATSESDATSPTDRTGATSESDATSPTGKAGAGGTLHVTNGDSTVNVLRAAGVTEPILPWRDVLHSGPVPALPAARLREVRARHLAAGGREAEVLASFAERDRAVREHRGDFQLWFEADLYDQLQLVQILSVLHELGVGPDRIGLICIGEFPGIGHFGGLGELSAEQLGGLRDTGAPLSATAVELARRAWAALCAPEPTGYAAIARAVSGELRFVPEAFDRLGREFPSTRDGLSLTERRLLAALVDGGLSAGEAFVRGAAREIRPFLGDATCFDLLTELAAGDRPLVRLDRTPDPDTPRRWRVALTDDGRRVLAGAADRLDLIGLDRWIGGVHLTGDRPGWRWDEGTESLVPHPAT